MLRFLNKLLRDFKTTSPARGGRRAPRRAMLQLEGLEDRLVMTTANPLASPLTHAIPLGASVAQTQPIVPHDASVTAQQNGSTLTITATPGSTVNIRSDGAGHMVVAGNQFLSSSISTVNINLQGFDTVQVDDSNGMPFAPESTINLFGNPSANNQLELFGSSTVGGSETFVPGSITHETFQGGILLPGGAVPVTITEVINQPATLTFNNYQGPGTKLTFSFDNSIGLVTDTIPTTGSLDVQTSGTNVQLSSVGNQQRLDGLGTAGGDSLQFANKPKVILDENAPDALVTLHATQPTSGQVEFDVHLHGTLDTTTIAATPSGVTTGVSTTIGQPANQAVVNLEANNGQVNINGDDQSTEVSIGNPVGNGLFSTTGIKANVNVSGAFSLFVNDNANPGAFTVANGAITGPGLFGSNVVVNFSDVRQVTWQTSTQSQTLQTLIVRPSVTGQPVTGSGTVTGLSAIQMAEVDAQSGSPLNVPLASIKRLAAKIPAHAGNGIASLAGMLSGVPA
jgi:hypothetical protein